MYTLKDLYLNENKNLHIGYPLKDDYNLKKLTLKTQKQLEAININFPVNYSKLIEVYLNYLKKEKLL